MRETFVTKNFRSSTIAVINEVNRIVDRYAGDGYSLTLRQLYYRLVSEGKIENKHVEYKRLGRIVNDARLAGLVSWSCIVDRTRNVSKRPFWHSPASILDSAVESFKLDRWENQAWRCEVWVEKDALVQVVGRACHDLDVPHLSCRGFISQSEMYAAGCRVKENLSRGQRTLIIHLADHDPSGIDMTRDIERRFGMFDALATVDRIALNMDQVVEYNPPPNWAKVTDSRYQSYAATYGNESWELDALEPSVLESLIRNKILEYRDDELWREIIEAEERMVLFLKSVRDQASDKFSG